MNKMHLQTTIRFHFTPLEWLLSRTQITKDVSEDMGEKEPLYNVDGNVN
jgi:hypothetical protein